MQTVAAPDLKAAREAAGWTQQQLATAGGVHVQTVKYLEGRPGPIRSGVAARLVLALRDVGVVLPEPVAPAMRVKAVPQPANRCGARTRAGTPCKAKALPGKRRCKLHGGKSTGPKTEAGRKAVAEAMLRRWEARRAHPVSTPAITPSVS